MSKRAEFVRKVGQDVVDKDAVAWCVEQFPSGGLQAITCRFELALWLENAREVLGIDWDHKPWADETAAVMRA